MKKRTRFLSLVLAVFMVFSMLPMIASAEGNVAQIGDVGFETFAAAYSAAKAGDTIELFDDVKLTGKLTITKDITINGNGHSIIADETAVWYTVSGKLNIKNYKTHLIGVNSNGVALKDIVLDCNNNAAGINIYCAQNVEFDNVSIINATKGTNAILTVNGSTLNIKNAFKVSGTKAAFDIDNGDGVTSSLGVTVEEGTVFDLANKTVVFESVADVEGLANAVDAEGNPYFAAMDSSNYYTQAQIDSRTTTYSNGLTLLNDVELKKDYTIKSTLNLNGHNLKVVKKLTATTVVGNGEIELTEKTATLDAPADLNVTTNLLRCAVSYDAGVYRVVEVALPEAEVKDIEDTLTASDPELTFALNFAIKDYEKLSQDQKYVEALLSAYGDYYVDYVLTIEGLTDDDVTFNADGNADGYLAGQYDAWSENWVSVPFEDVTIKNGQSLYIMEYAAKLMNQPGLRFKLFEVVEIVKNFDCGVYFTPEFIAANPAAKITLELKVFKDEDLNNVFEDEISMAKNVFRFVALPEVEITDIKDTLTAEDPDLTFALNFAIKDYEELSKDEAYVNALLSAYGNYYVDYVLTIEGLTDDDVTFNADGNADGYLAGQYDAWSENWVSVPFEDVTIENGQSLYIMEYAAKLMNQPGLRFKLFEVVEIVKNFDCGVYFTPEFIEANPDAVITLELKVFKDDDKDNVFEDEIKVATNVFKFENIVAMIKAEGKQSQYFSTIAGALAKATDGDTVILLKDCADENAATVIPAGVTLDLNGKYLTAKNILSFGNVIDTAAEVGGIKISNDTSKAFTQLQPNNTYLPIYDSANGCYRFFAYEVRSGISTKNLTNAVKFRFAFVFENAEAYKLLANTANESELAFNLELQWTGLEKSISYTFNPSTIAAFANMNTEGFNGSSAYNIIISGLDKLEGKAEVSATHSVVSSTNALHTFNKLEYTYITVSAE